MAAIDFSVNPITLQKVDPDTEDIHLALLESLRTRGGVKTIVPGLDFVVSYHTLEGATSNFVLDGSAADRARSRTFMEKVDRRLPISAVWRITVNLYPFGSGIGTGIAERKKKAQLSILYTSKVSFEDTCSDVAQKCSTKDSSGSYPSMDIVVSINGIGQVLSDATMQTLCTVNDAFFLEHQCSYSNSTYLTLSNFELPDSVTNPADAFNQAIQQHDPTFLEQINCYIADKVDDVHWHSCVNKAVTDLNDWSEAIQPQHGYNEATRSLIVQSVTRAAALYSGKPMYIQPTQCVGTVPPRHFLGTGPLDVIFGGQTIVAHARDVNDSDDDNEEGEDEEEGGEVNVKASSGAQYKYQAWDADITPGRVVKEIKISSTVGNLAFCQLSRIVHDHAYVSDERQRDIADVSGRALLADPRHAATMKRKRGEIFSAERQEAKRAHTKVTGIITTGNSWDCFLYTAPDDRPESKFSIKYLGHLDMPVLTYKVVSPDPTVTTSSSSLGAGATRRGSGATTARSVRKEDVERVVAMLLVGSENKFSP